jgi:hypothetical protein
VAVVAPFFATNALSNAEPNEPSRPRRNAREEDQENEEVYRDYLRKLERNAEQRLPERLAARTNFVLIAPERVRRALAAQEKTPNRLFGQHGRIRDNRFPTPDAEAIRRLAAALNADAVLLCALDEPEADRGRPIFTGFNVYTRRARVQTRGQFALLLKDGTEVLRRVLEVGQPRTWQPGARNAAQPRDYLLVDWRETQDLLIENFLEELARYR